MPLQRRMYAAFTRFCRRKEKTQIWPSPMNAELCSLHRPSASHFNGEHHKTHSLSHDLWATPSRSAAPRLAVPSRRTTQLCPMPQGQPVNNDLQSSPIECVALARSVHHSLSLPPLRDKNLRCSALKWKPPSSPEPLPRSTLRDGGQENQVGGHIQ